MKLEDYTTFLLNLLWIYNNQATWYWHKVKQINGTGQRCTERKPHIHDQWNFKKDAKVIQWGKDSFFFP